MFEVRTSSCIGAGGHGPQAEHMQAGIGCEEAELAWRVAGRPEVELPLLAPGIEVIPAVAKGLSSPGKGLPVAGARSDLRNLRLLQDNDLDRARIEAAFGKVIVVEISFAVGWSDVTLGER